MQKTSPLEHLQTDLARAIDLARNSTVIAHASKVVQDSCRSACHITLDYRHPPAQQAQEMTSPHPSHLTGPVSLQPLIGPS